MLFWSCSTADEERTFRLARLGHVASIVLLSLTGSIELIYLCALILYLIK